MSWWLVKTEPDVYSIDHFQSDKITCWNHVRNYQARNNLQAMVRGDLVLIYHSNASPSAIVGLASVNKIAYPDPSQFDKKSDYYDPKASLEKPRWYSPDLKFVKKFARQLDLQTIKKTKELSSMSLVKGGSRLSVQLVAEDEYKTILKLVGER